MTLNFREKRLLRKHVREQKKVRKVPLEYRDDEVYIEMLTEGLYFMALDFLKANGFADDKEKLKLAWEYLREKLS